MSSARSCLSRLFGPALALAACGDAGSGDTTSPTGAPVSATVVDPTTDTSAEPSSGAPAPTSTDVAPGDTASSDDEPDTITGSPTTATTVTGTTVQTGEDTGTSGEPVSNKCPPVSPTASAVCVEGRQLLVGRRDGGVLAPEQPYRIAGVCWAPTGVGEANTQGYADYYVQYGGVDAPHIEALNANTIKTYDPFARTPAGLALLDDLHSRGIMVAMSVIVYHGDSVTKNYLAAVELF
jgi:hypothetical protein